MRSRPRRARGATSTASLRSAFPPSRRGPLGPGSQSGDPNACDKQAGNYRLQCSRGCSAVCDRVKLVGTRSSSHIGM